VKKNVRRDKRQWIDEHAQRAKEAERRGTVKELYSITKILPKKVLRRDKPVRNKRGEILSTQEEQPKRWREYFSEILNKNEGQDIQEEVSKETNEHNKGINLHPPTHEKVRSALKQIKDRKTPGMENIITEVLKADTETTCYNP
jgi:hypothetical protein